MNCKKSKMLNCLYFIAAVVLLIGLGSAVLIYLTAEDASDDMMIYEFEHSKLYRHDLELYGGKMNVLASEFMHWFEGLWHGKTLALTVACITIVVTFGFLFAAYILPSEGECAANDRGGRDVTDDK